MQKNQYKKYRQLLKIRDMVIVAVLVFVGLFYYFSLSGDGESEPQMYRAETVEQAETFGWEDGSRETSGAAKAGTTVPNAAGAAGSAEAANDTVTETAAPEADNTGTAQTPAAENSGAAADDRINLNTASLEELDSLPGIGPATAKLILEYRQQYGGFAAPEEIMNVKRIGDKTYEKLKDRIRV